MGNVITFVLGVVLGAISSWVITHQYYKKAAADQKAEFDRLQGTLRAKNTLRDFEDFVDSSTWKKQQKDERTLWICDADNTFKIEEGQRNREFEERWTKVYPDKRSSASPVYLKIGAVVIKELTFISMDGYRIFVPMPELRPAAADDIEYFWNRSSLGVKVCKIIGQYYIYENLEGVARRSGVAIID